MTRHVAFLRGVSPMNCRMPQLKRCFEKAGFSNVKTLLSSGNVAFDASGAPASLERRIEAAMAGALGRTFRTLVRPSAHLQRLVKADPFAVFRLPPEAKRIVTFLPATPKARLTLPLEHDRAYILAVKGREVFSAYLPNPRGPVFMSLIEKTFGKDVTTRTWDTVRKCAVA
jgi:uncharacterized protein (DUF1697 family)